MNSGSGNPNGGSSLDRIIGLVGLHFRGVSLATRIVGLQSIRVGLAIRMVGLHSRIVGLATRMVGLH